MIADTQSVAASVRTDVLAALRTASRKTGLDFDYLLHTAMRESSLDIQAKSKTSSATGLFQFVEQTWLGLVKQYGQRYGLGSYANAIEQNKDGHYAVASADTKSAILALRQDPELSALMAGENAKQTKQSLECALGREVCGGELYAAHFLGPSGARHLIELKERNPDARADLAFPQAAKGNRSAFYHADGTAKTVGEVYAWAVDSVDVETAPSSPAAQPQAVATNARAIDASTLFPSFAAPERVEVTAEREPAARKAPDTSPGQPGAVLPRSIVAAVPQSVPQSPLLLTPGIVEILASLSPMATRRAG